ncbi:hypothetical protein M0802_001518 [Mischocyttarus mexicanus]|nr:hypothetical protein M0802_001518 [Mischocyttarus mexicanus]
MSGLRCQYVIPCTLAREEDDREWPWGSSSSSSNTGATAAVVVVAAVAGGGCSPWKNRYSTLLNRVEFLRPALAPAMKIVKVLTVVEMVVVDIIKLHLEQCLGQMIEVDSERRIGKL